MAGRDEREPHALLTLPRGWLARWKGVWRARGGARRSVCGGGGGGVLGEHVEDARAAGGTWRRGVRGAVRGGGACGGGGLGFLDACVARGERGGDSSLVAP